MGPSSPEKKGITRAKPFVKTAIWTPCRRCGRATPGRSIAPSRSRRTGGGTGTLTPIQSEILRILEETGGIEPTALLQRFGGKLTAKELEREFSALRHMEKARGEKRQDRVVWRLW